MTAGHKTLMLMKKGDEGQRMKETAKHKRGATLELFECRQLKPVTPIEAICFAIVVPITTVNICIESN